MMLADVHLATGSSDCEAIGPGLVAQPVNTWTSVAYLLAGAWIIARSRRWRLDPSAVVFGALVAANGVGSMAFHASADSLGRWIHDLSILGALGFVAGWHVGRLRSAGSARAGRWAIGAAGVVLLAMGVVLVPVPDATNAAVAVLVGIALVAFVARRITTHTGPAWSDLPFVLVAAVALGAFLLGRTGSPACDPDGTFQFHGAWHIATALLAVVWVRGALNVLTRGRSAARAGIDEMIASAAGLVVGGFFREVDVDGRVRISRDRPVLIVMNHFNGLVDPVVAVHALGRLPRFIAKATLWNVVPARPFLALAGLIPVHRAVDGGTGSTGNRSSFAACHAVLAKGGTVAIFPEGTTSARSRLAPVKTGAARIALGAYAAGVEDLVIVPVGIAYEDRVAFRGRAFVDVGTPLVVADLVHSLVAAGAAVAEDDHAAVGHLTRAIERGLRACAPDYDTPRDEATMQLAAKIALRPDGATDREPCFGEVERTARRLSRAPADLRRRIDDALAAYALDLRLGGLTDAEITPGPALLARFRRALTMIVLLVVLLPVIIVGLAVNLVPYLVVRLASRRVRVPVTKGTVRMLVGIAVFPLSWIVVAVVLTDGWWAALIVVACPIVGFAALWAVDEAWLNVRALNAWRAARGERRWFVENLRVHRTALVATVSAALEAAPAPDDSAAGPVARPGPVPTSPVGQRR